MKTHSPLLTLNTTSEATPRAGTLLARPCGWATRPLWWSVHTRLWIACTLCALVPGIQAQWVQQNIPLRPGWNAVFLEVHPEPADCDQLFAGLPVESVWDWNRPSDGVQFVQDPATMVPGTTGWLTWFPRDHALSSQTSLFSLRDGRPYLIKLADNAQPITWPVVGKPSLRGITWRPGEVNFVGFRVGTPAPTFQALFAGETGLVGQPVYALDTSGVWQTVPNHAIARPNPATAYWVRCRLPAQRTGTIAIEAGSREGIRFLEGEAETSFRVRNTSPSARNISIQLLPSAAPPPGQPPLAGPIPLEYWKTDFALVEFGWEPFPATLRFTALPPGSEWNLRLGLRRTSAAVAAPGFEFQGLLEVTDDLGTRWLIPISAESTPGQTAPAGLRPADSHLAVAHAGLWVGEAVLNAVSQPAHAANPMLTRPAGGEIAIRLIVHVDGGGTARLLQRAYIVRKPPVFAPDPENPGFDRVVEPPRTVVATDESLISGIIGAGEITGRRISSAAFGFTQPQPLSGGPFGVGVLNGQLTMGHNDPLNPFKHVYHPDHDNLDERFEQTLPDGRESFTVIRQISMNFTGTDPLGLDPPGWGDDEMGGAYRETIGGLHRDLIHTSGAFRLRRITRVPILNDDWAMGMEGMKGASR